jgi:hypothetical protein
VALPSLEKIAFVAYISNTAERNVGRLPPINSKIEQWRGGATRLGERTRERTSQTLRCESRYICWNNLPRTKVKKSYPVPS